jgi:hypothetical protein
MRLAGKICSKHEIKVITNGEKSAYKKTPQRVYGPAFEPKTRLATAVEMTV